MMDLNTGTRDYRLIIIFVDKTNNYSVIIAAFMNYSNTNPSQIIRSSPLWRRLEIRHGV
jgi:phage terminase large subunit-like protein